MTIGSFGKIEKPEGAYAVTILGPYISAVSEKAGHPRTDQFNHPTDVAVDSDGDIYVVRLGQPPGLRLRFRGWPDHHADRRCAGPVQVGPAEHRRQPGHDEGPAPGEEPRAAMAVLLPDPVEFDPESDSVIVADSQRNRLQIYKKVRNYSDFQANL